MPLPFGNIKSRSDLINQADTTFKTNGGPGLAKTGGNNERQFIADVLETFLLKSENHVALRAGNTPVFFDKNCIYLGGLSVVRNSNVVFDFSNAKRGCVAKFFSQRTTPPTITASSGALKLLEAHTIESYNPTLINVYIFRYIGFNGIEHIVEYNRYTIDV